MAENYIAGEFCSIYRRTRYSTKKKQKNHWKPWNFKTKSTQHTTSRQKSNNRNTTLKFVKVVGQGHNFYTFPVLWAQSSKKMSKIFRVYLATRFSNYNRNEAQSVGLEFGLVQEQNQQCRVRCCSQVSVKLWTERLDRASSYTLVNQTSLWLAMISSQLPSLLLIGTIAWRRRNNNLGLRPYLIGHCGSKLLESEIFRAIATIANYHTIAG